MCTAHEDVLDRSGDLHDTLDDPELPFVGQDTIESGDVSRSVDVSTLLSRLPSLARDTQKEDADGQILTVKPAVGATDDHVLISTATISSTSHIRNNLNKPHNVSPDGRTRMIDIERIPYRNDSSMSSVKDPSNKHVSPGIMYGGVSSTEAEMRQRVEPSVGLVNSPYRMEESIRRRSNGHMNHGGASAGGPR